MNRQAPNAVPACSRPGWLPRGRRLPARLLRAALLAAVVLATPSCGGGSQGSPASGPATEGGAVRVLLVGDSLTHGKAGDWTWRYHLWQHLQEHEDEAVDLVGPADDLLDGSQDYRDAAFDRDHASLWGTTVSPAFYEPDWLGRVYRPDVVVVELGANDLTRQQEPPDDVAAAMRATIEDLRAAAPGVDVVLVRIPVPALPGATELNELYDELAEELDSDEERLVVAAAEEGFVADPAAPDTDTYDGLHPDASGEVKLATAVADALAQLGLGDDG